MNSDTASVDDALTLSLRTPAWRLLLSKPTTVTSAVVVVLVICLASFGEAIAPYGINDVDVSRALQGPTGAHWLGTDDLGRDILSRIMFATRVTMEVCVIAVAFALVVGVLIGVVAGYAGGWIDTVLMRVIDVMFAFPVILLALAIIAILGPGVISTTVAIGVVYSPIFARVARASTLATRVEPFVQASQTIGTPAWRILGTRILPNISSPIIVQTSLSLAFAILSEASLSYLGLGVQPPEPSWGGMLFAAQSFIGQAWWMSVFPGAAIFITALAFNLLGDGLRDVLDPRQRSVMEARR